MANTKAIPLLMKTGFYNGYDKDSKPFCVTVHADSRKYEAMPCYTVAILGVCVIYGNIFNIVNFIFHILSYG